MKSPKLQSIKWDEPDVFFFFSYAFYDNHVFFKNSVIYKGEIIYDNTGTQFPTLRIGGLSSGGGGAVSYSVSKETYSCYIEGLGSFSWDVYEVTFYDQTGETTISMSVDGIVERNLAGNIGAEDLVYQVADAMAGIMKRMGGVSCFEAVTNITVITITDNAQRYYKNAEHNYYDALITSRQSGSTIYLSAELVRNQSRHGADLESTLAHEIGHNVFWNFVGFESPGLSSSGHEWTANVFMFSLEYRPKYQHVPAMWDYRFNSSKLKLIFGSNNLGSYVNFIDNIWGIK